MNSLRFLVGHRLLILMSLVVLLSTSARAADTKAVRLAIGPFFAPVAEAPLQQASRSIPEMLMVELSQQSRFHLVEREKVDGILSEMKLTSSGLVARDTVARLGRVLACDWLVSGTLVQAGGKIHVWTKVVDVRSGVVLDLYDTPYEGTDYSSVIPDISRFLAVAGTRVNGRQFITMGRFFDMNPPDGPKRDDWSRRIPIVAEQFALKNGYGVVEMAAVGPIFNERQLETAGLTGNPENTVQLKPAFWMVDGGCGWVEGEPLRLGVCLRIQQIGGIEKIVRLTNSPGEAIERDIVATLNRALSITNRVTNSNPNAECDVLASRGRELAEKRMPFQAFGVRKVKTEEREHTQWDDYKDYLQSLERANEHKKALLANAERLLLRDPDNQQAKMMLAHGFLGDPAPAKKQKGLEMLREVAANKKNPDLAAAASSVLTNERMLQKLMSNRSQPHPRPKDWRSLNQAYEDYPDNQEYKCDLAAVLIGRRWETDREKGRKLLSEVATGDDKTQAERARELLALPEKIPFGNVPKTTVATPAPVTPKPEPEPEEDATTAARREFLQMNFDKFFPARFEKDGPTFARIQTMPVRDNLIEFRGRYYCGFRFTMPPVLQGDLKWMYLAAKTEAQKDHFVSNSEWYIVRKQGTMKGFTTYDARAVAEIPDLNKRFPFTKNLVVQHLPQGNLLPGQEYAIWFSFEQKDVPYLPDIAFALSLQSPKDVAEFGKLPLK